MTDRKLPDIPPITLNEVEEWLIRLEDIATIERDLGFAMRLVMVSLFKRMTASGMLDGHGFIHDLQQGLHQIEAEHHRLATQGFLDDLQSALPPRSLGGFSPTDLH